MKGLNIPATEKSPRVLFDTANYIFEIQGNSRTENGRDFYFPIIYKLRKHFEKVIDKKRMPGDVNTKYHEAGVAVTKNLKTIYYTANNFYQKHSHPPGEAGIMNIFFKICMISMNNRNS